MKKIYALLMLLPMMAWAQNDVTFIVDMTQYTGSTANGVFVNGTFNNWCGSCNPMSDPEGDSIWTVTLPLTDSTFEYKFTVDGWNSSESFQDSTVSCIQPGPYYYDLANCGGYCLNRYAAVAGDTILPGVAWNDCSGVAGKVYMTFQVNMSYTAVDPTGVFLAGGGFGNPGVNEMYPIGDSVYSKTLRADTGFYSMFTFLSANDPNWGAKENIIGKPCAVGAFSDRDMVGYSATMGLMGDFHYRTCFGECTTDGTCPAPQLPQNYTFQVDLGLDFPGDSAYIRGADINGWAMPGIPMTNVGNDIWEITLTLSPGTYEYKFSAGSNGAGAIEEALDPATSDSVCTLTTSGFTNRLVTVAAGMDSTLDVNCWESCGPCSGIGIEEDAAAFIVKPNPASDVLFVEAAAGTSEVAVYSVTGALVMEQSFDGAARLDVAALPRGMYIVRVQNGSSERVVRVALK